MSTTDDTNKRLERIRTLRDDLDKLDDTRNRLLEDLYSEVYDFFPENRGVVGRPPRGAIQQVMEASGWSRPQIDNIRAGKYKKDAPASDES